MTAGATRGPVPSSSEPDGPFGWAERLVTGYELEGPRVRLGVFWFVLAVGSAVLGVVAVAMLFGLVAAAAGLQASAAWRRAGRRTNQIVAGAGALALAFAATLGIGLTGLAALVFVGTAFAAAVVVPSRRMPPVVAAAITVRCGFFVGLAAASAVFLARTDSGALITLVVLVSGFEVGDYLVGTGAATAVEGPIAGIAAVVVLTFAVAVFQFPPFDGTSAWVFGGLAAVLAPLGRFVAPVLVPPGAERVPALRRLDSYLLAAPVWAFMLWSYLL
jgi:hypothetical protein